MILHKRELDINPNFDKSVATIFDIVSDAVSERQHQLDGANARPRSREATRRLELFFRKLGEERLDTEFTWQTRDYESDVFVSAGAASALSKWLALAVPVIEQIVVRGYLRRADTLTGAFKVEHEATGRMYEGSGDTEVLAHAEMDALYEAEITLERQTAPHTGRVTEKMKLVGLRPVVTGKP